VRALYGNEGRPRRPVSFAGSVGAARNSFSLSDFPCRRAPSPAHPSCWHTRCERIPRLSMNRRFCFEQEHQAGRQFLRRQTNMGLLNNDEIEGKFDQAKGAVKDKVGEATGDRDLETEGEADRASGNVQEGFGTARRKVGETIEDIGNKISR
jgi:uncharacterized protein YjbJ (UPF0337 family)